MLAKKSWKALPNHNESLDFWQHSKVTRQHLTFAPIDTLSCLGSVTRTITHTVLLLAGGSCYIVPCKLNSKEEVLETLAEEAGEGLSLFRFCRRLGFWVILLPALGRRRPLVSGKGGRGVQVLFAHERTQLSATWVHLRLAFAQNN